ncbi:uncharacterized protein FFNC_05508 [Fusarium fujikuroi]|nr:uncharacterized protein FFNC_05508 [Fusarium fujikuroi]
MKTGLIVCILAAVTAYSASHEAPYTSKPSSVGHAVNNLEKTLEFFHGVVGLEILHQDKRPVYDEAYGRLTATRGATYKMAVVAIPNQDWTLNLVEYMGISKKQIKQREKDPAAPALTLTVKNATAINNALRRANVSTIDGSPIPKGGAEGTTSTVWVYDPDGYMVELVQRSGPSDYFTVSEPNITDGPGMEYVIRGQLDLTMYNVTGALTFYRDILGQNISRGFEPLIGTGYEKVGGLGGLFNLSTDTYWAAVTGNCDPETRCEYYEYDDPSRVSIIYPAQDPGVGMTTYSVQNLDAIADKVKATKIKVITEGDRPVWVDGKKSILVRDPAGYLVRLDQAC